MFKFLVFAVLIVAAAAAPSYYHHHHEPAHVVLSVEPEYAHVGSVVKHYPVATSHQSRTDYHSEPVVKTILAPVEYVQPVVHHAPAIVHHQHVEPAVVYSAAPLVHSHHSAPVLSYASSPVHHW